MARKQRAVEKNSVSLGIFPPSHHSSFEAKKGYRAWNRFRIRRESRQLSGLWCMDDVYAINLAKTILREGYNEGDPERVLSVYDDTFADMSFGMPSFYYS